MTKRIVVISDMQIPDHNQQAVRNLARFVQEFDPDELVCVGDDVDSPQPSQWSKGQAGEYAGTLQEDMDQARTVHRMFRDALGDKPYHLSRSNHGDRVSKYIGRYAPALGSLRALQLDELAGYRELGITYHSEPFQVAPQWVCAHGDEGTFSSIPGRTAGLLAAKWGVSVVCGHTHSAGICPTSTGYGGIISKTVWGMEVGHLMDMSKATYLKGGYGNWQSAFGLLYISKAGVHPVLVPINGAAFTVEGVTYGA